MITEFLFGAFFKAAAAILDLLPAFQFELDSANFQNAMGVLRGALYLFPLGTVQTIAGITISLLLFRIALSFIRLLWSFIPVIGN